MRVGAGRALSSQARPQSLGAPCQPEGQPGNDPYSSAEAGAVSAATIIGTVTRPGHERQKEPCKCGWQMMGFKGLGAQDIARLWRCDGRERPAAPSKSNQDCSALVEARRRFEPTCCWSNSEPVRNI